MGVNADSCESTQIPTHQANSNFVFRSASNGWTWASGTIPGTMLNRDGIISWDMYSHITVVCIHIKTMVGMIVMETNFLVTHVRLQYRPRLILRTCGVSMV